MTDSRVGTVFLRILLFIALCSISSTTSAETTPLNFRQAYSLALSLDTSWLAAGARARAEEQERNLGRSGLLPNVSFRYSAGRNDSESRQDGVGRSTTQTMRYSNTLSSFTLTQALFDASALAQFREGQARADAGSFTMERARQALAVRVLQAYTDALYADDSLALALAQARTLREDALRAQRFVAAGEGTRTDQLEVEARARIVEALVVDAEEQVRNARNSLQVIIGGTLGGAPLAPLHAERLDMLEVDSRDVSSWRSLALGKNPELAAQRLLVEASAQRYLAARALHYPTVRLYARRQLTESNAENQVGQRYDTNSVGVEVNVPIFSGGYASAASGQALALQQEAQYELETATRAMLNDLERQYGTLHSSARRIEAYQQAVDSATARIYATRQSVKGGERSNLDVLDAERQLFEAQLNLSRTRYDRILAWLSLRWQAGILEDVDVELINSMFLFTEKNKAPELRQSGRVATASRSN